MQLRHLAALAAGAALAGSPAMAGERANEQGTGSSTTSSDVGTGSSHATGAYEKEQAKDAQSRTSPEQTQAVADENENARRNGPEGSAAIDSQSSAAGISGSSSSDQK